MLICWVVVSPPCTIQLWWKTKLIINGDVNRYSTNYKIRHKFTFSSLYIPRCIFNAIETVSYRIVSRSSSRRKFTTFIEMTKHIHSLQHLYDARVKENRIQSIRTCDECREYVLCRYALLHCVVLHRCIALFWYS